MWLVPSGLSVADQKDTSWSNERMNRYFVLQSRSGSAAGTQITAIAKGAVSFLLSFVGSKAAPPMPAPTSMSALAPHSREQTSEQNREQTSEQTSEQDGTDISAKKKTTLSGATAEASQTRPSPSYPSQTRPSQTCPSLTQAACKFRILWQECETAPFTRPLSCIAISNGRADIEDHWDCLEERVMSLLPSGRSAQCSDDDHQDDNDTAGKDTDDECTDELAHCTRMDDKFVHDTILKLVAEGGGGCAMPVQHSSTTDWHHLVSNGGDTHELERPDRKLPSQRLLSTNNQCPLDLVAQQLCLIFGNVESIDTVITATNAVEYIANSAGILALTKTKLYFYTSTDIEEAEKNSTSFSLPPSPSKHPPPRPASSAYSLELLQIIQVRVNQRFLRSRLLEITTRKSSDSKLWQLDDPEKMCRFIEQRCNGLAKLLLGQHAKPSAVNSSSATLQCTTSSGGASVGMAQCQNNDSQIGACHHLAEEGHARSRTATATSEISLNSPSIRSVLDFADGISTVQQEKYDNDAFFFRIPSGTCPVLSFACKLYKSVTRRTGAPDEKAPSEQPPATSNEGNEERISRGTLFLYADYLCFRSYSDLDKVWMTIPIGLVESVSKRTRGLVLLDSAIILSISRSNVTYIFGGFTENHDTAYDFILSRMHSESATACSSIPHLDVPFVVIAEEAAIGMLVPVEPLQVSLLAISAANAADSNAAISHPSAKSGEKWLAFFNASGHDQTMIKNMQLRQLLLSDPIPIYARTRLWIVLSGIGNYKLPHGYYQSLFESPNVAPSVRDEIEKDLKRSFPEHPAYQDRIGTDALRRVLTAYAARNSTIGYAQAMNLIAAALLLVLPEECAFMLLCEVCDRWFPEHYGVNLIGAAIDQKVFEHVLAESLPKISDHLNSIKFDLTMISFAWFMGFFMTAFNVSLSLKVLDFLWLEGPPVLFWTALAVMHLNSAEILAANDEEKVFAIIRKYYATLRAEDDAALPTPASAHRTLLSTAIERFASSLDYARLAELRAKLCLDVVHSFSDRSSQSIVRRIGAMVPQFGQEECEMICDAVKQVLVTSNVDTFVNFDIFRRLCIRLMPWRPLASSTKTELSVNISRALALSPTAPTVSHDGDVDGGGGAAHQQQSDPHPALWYRMFRHFVSCIEGELDFGEVFSFGMARVLAIIMHGTLQERLALLFVVHSSSAEPLTAFDQSYDVLSDASRHGLAQTDVLSLIQSLLWLFQGAPDEAGLFDEISHLFVQICACTSPAAQDGHSGVGLSDGHDSDIVRLSEDYNNSVNSGAQAGKQVLSLGEFERIFMTQQRLSLYFSDRAISLSVYYRQ